MPTAPVGTKQYLGKGKLYIDRLTSAGARTGERFIGNVTELTLAVAPETKEMYSSAEAGAPLLAKDVIRQKHTLAFKTTEMTVENMALFLLGNEGLIEQTGDDVTAEAIDGVLQDRYYPLAYRNIDVTTEGKIPVVKDDKTPTPTTFDVDDDYTIDAVTGRIYIVPGGAIADKTNLKIDYTYKTVKLAKVTAAAVGTITAFMRFIGDPTRGPKLDAEIWCVSIAPDGTLGFIADDYGAFGFTAEILTDAANHPDDPYYRIIDRLDLTPAA